MSSLNFFTVHSLRVVAMLLTLPIPD
jgi:hypothetical protein